MKHILAIDQSTLTKALLLTKTPADRSATFRINRRFQKTDGSRMIRWKSGRTPKALPVLLLKTGINSDGSLASASATSETALVWDRHRLPVYDAIVWQCVRGAKICEGLSDYAEMVREHTGLRPSIFLFCGKDRMGSVQNAGDLSRRHLVAARLIRGSSLR